MPADLMKRSSIKRSHNHLKQVIEAIVADEFNLRARGLSFLIDDLEVFGRPMDLVKVWATLHFLTLGSPFCCAEPGCHVLLHAENRERINENLRTRIGLVQQVSIEFRLNANSSHAGVIFDDVFTGRNPLASLSDIDQRDALGRTALMRAAIRGQNHVVEELLTAGADPTVVDNRGRGIVEQLGAGQMWIRVMLEEALAKRTE